LNLPCYKSTIKALEFENTDWQLIDKDKMQCMFIITIDGFVLPPSVLEWYQTVEDEWWCFVSSAAAALFLSEFHSRMMCTASTLWQQRIKLASISRGSHS